MGRYYQPEIETASREEILRIQNEKIVKQVKHVYENVKYYRDLMDKKESSPRTSRAWMISKSFRFCQRQICEILIPTVCSARI